VRAMRVGEERRVDSVMEDEEGKVFVFVGAVGGEEGRG